MARMGLLGWLRGGSDEVGWDDLVRRVVDAIAETGRYGARGRIAFPAGVEVHISIAGGGAAVARGFVEDAAFDREVGAQLANRCDCAAADLPLREYEVEEGPRTRVSITEAAVRPWTIRIEGGDRDGVELALDGAQEEIRFGRGEWHGADRHVRNDLVVAVEAEFVSRRAGRLWRVGNRLEVEALDQGDDLQVRRADGSSVRPARTASGRVPLTGEDAVELGEGRPEGRAVRLRIRRG